MAGKIVVGEHTHEEILDSLNAIDEVAVCTRSGDRLRARMMHFAVDEEFNFYLSSMKGDPKILQITADPTTSLLVLDRRTEQNGWREIEVTGRAAIVTDDAERQKALELTAGPSPIVAHLKSIGQEGLLDFIRVTPLELKMRIFGEIVAGMPPTVIEFEEHQKAVSDTSEVRRKLRSWREGVRTISLLGSAVAVTVGLAAAWNMGDGFRWVAAILTLVAAVAIQAGTNALNDYFDHRAGNDEANREFVRPFSGGSRVIQLGLMTPVETLLLGVGLCSVAVVIGLLLAVDGRPWVLAFGAAGLVSGVFYAAPPFRWAGKGLGEILVALNFGVLMVAAAYYVQTGEVTREVLLGSLPVALLIALVLYVNQFPDYNADMRTGKRTLVVRLGRPAAARLFVLFASLPMVLVAALVATGDAPAPALAALAATPLLVQASLIVLKHHESPFDMAPANALVAIAHLTGGLLFALGYAWDELGRDGLPLAIALGALGVGYIAYMYRSVERQRQAFAGVKQVMGR